MAKHHYYPLNDCILIEPEPEKPPSTTIILPEKFAHGQEDPPKWGKVIAKGPTCKDREISVGDRVLYGKFSWAKVPIDDEKFYAVVREYDCLVVDG